MHAEPRTIQDLLKDFSTRGHKGEIRVLNTAPFVPEFVVCDKHGRSPANSVDAKGNVRWYQPGCPLCRKHDQTLALVANADISPRFMECTFENYRTENPGQTRALKTCRDYAENFKANLKAGRCLIMRGNPGTGKNHLSAAIMKEVLKQNFTTLRIKANAFLDEYWAKDFSEREPWMKRIGNVDLLVIDEIGRTSNGKAANDAFFRLIDSRYEAMKPTIVISNLSREEMIDIMGHAAYDRLGEGGGSAIEFKWGSARRD
jgi:DNA replication protein DnaC